MEHNLKNFPLPVDIVGEILLMLSFTDLHNFRFVCKGFNQLLEACGNRAWNRAIQQMEPPMPRIPQHMTATQYFNLAFTFKCSVQGCTSPSAATIVWEEAKRYCSGCRTREKREYSVESIVGPYAKRVQDLVPWAWSDDALRPWSFKDVNDPSRFQVVKLYHRRMIVLMLVESSGMDEQQFQAWHSRKRADRERTDQEIDTFVEWMRERVRRAFRRDVGRVRAENVVSRFRFKPTTPENITIPRDEFLQHPITVGIIEAHRALTADPSMGKDKLWRSFYDQADDINNDWFIAKTKHLVSSIREAYSGRMDSNVKGDSFSADPTAHFDISDYEQCRSFLSLGVITFQCESCLKIGYYPYSLAHRCQDITEPYNSMSTWNPMPLWISGRTSPMLSRDVTIFVKQYGYDDPTVNEVYSLFIERALRFKPDVPQYGASTRLSFLPSHYDRAAEITRLCGLDPLKASSYDMAQVVLECKVCAASSMKNERYRLVDESPFSARLNTRRQPNNRAKGFKVFMTCQRAILHLSRYPNHQGEVSEMLRVVPLAETFQHLINIDALVTAEVEQPNWKIQCGLCSWEFQKLNEVLDHLSTHGVPRSMKSVSILPAKTDSNGDPVDRLTGFVPPILVQRVAS